MINEEYINEAKKITKLIINKKKFNTNLNDLIKDNIDKKYYNDIIKISFYISNYLTDNNYHIISINPFEINKNI